MVASVATKAVNKTKRRLLQTEFPFV